MNENFPTGTNAVCERLFSLINNYWTDKKSELSMETLKSWLAIKQNCKMSCSQFYEFILSKSDLIQQIHSSEKYKNQ